MNEIKSSAKLTLDECLINPQGQDQCKLCPQEIIFPKINTKLKKAHFTKYLCAFSSVKSCAVNIQPDQQQKVTSRPPAKKTNTEAISKGRRNQRKSRFQHNKNLWKLNKSHHQSYIQPSAKTDKSHAQPNQQHEVAQKRKEKLFLQQTISSNQMNKNIRFSLIKQIRQLKISPIPHAETTREQNSKLRTSQQINESIVFSSKIISLIKKNKTKSNGLFDNKHKVSQLQKLEQNLGLFSYLKRNFIVKKQQLSPQKVSQYFLTPSNKKLQAEINLQSRSFLQQKLHKDYNSYHEVFKLRQDLSKKAIRQQMQQKKLQFSSQYSKKYNVPYLTFLSLPNNLKINVLKNLSDPPQKPRKRV